ncbi:MAG TPA: COX15/CtaA family protein [Acidimicrobiales bacterium]|nr:COX15/CtaA family protein [Acidimicrobiales bacterium]
MRHFPVSPARFRQIVAATVGGYALLVVTGGAVRLTDSGLGCPDWPSCYGYRLTPKLALHPWVEFGNRLVTVAISVLSVVLFLAALRLRRERRDLLGPAAAILGALVAQIVLGGVLVLTHLNPYLVALHFVFTLGVLAVALVLFHRAGAPPGPVAPLVGGALTLLSRLVLVVLTALVCLGTTVTGAGPHAGGAGSKRIPVAFRDIAEAHSTVALFLIGVVLALLFALHEGKAPATSQRKARLLFELLALQGVIGYTQYFLHDAAGVVELHLAGVTAAWCAAVSYYLSLHEHHPVAAAPTGGALGGEAELAVAR